jgi:CheY-like chemotaxis protein
MRVLIVEDEPYLADAIRDGLRLEAIAADIAGDGDTALELLSVNAYDIAVLDRDIPGPSRSSSENSCSVSEHWTAGVPTTGRLCERSQACGWIRSAERSTATAATSR